eukprot:4000303-Lingulodinium_polyedra.AAC.1
MVCVVRKFRDGSSQRFWVFADVHKRSPCPGLSSGLFVSSKWVETSVVSGFRVRQFCPGLCHGWCSGRVRWEH